MSSKSKSDSIRHKLIDLGKKMGVRHANLETVFLIERLVARFVSDPVLSKRLVFKGGFVGLRVYDSPRYTLTRFWLNLTLKIRLSLLKKVQRLT